jgi:hypothetical protein
MYLFKLDEQVVMVTRMHALFSHITDLLTLIIDSKLFKYESYIFDEK